MARRGRLNFQLRRAGEGVWTIRLTFKDTRGALQTFEIGKLIRLRAGNTVTDTVKFEFGNDAWASEVADAFWAWYMGLIHPRKKEPAN